MPKERIFKFTDVNAPEEERVKEVTAMSYKRAVKSYQGGSKANEAAVEWTTQGGEEFYKVQKLPMGRSKKIGK